MMQNKIAPISQQNQAWAPFPTSQQIHYLLAIIQCSPNKQNTNNHRPYA